MIVTIADVGRRVVVKSPQGDFLCRIVCILFADGLVRLRVLTTPPGLLEGGSEEGSYWDVDSSTVLMEFVE